MLVVSKYLICRFVTIFMSSTASASNSLMIIFNGMYFRGSWKHPFDSIEPGTFYKSNTEKNQVPMMKTKGVFKTGALPGLDSTAIELPYDVRVDNNYYLKCFMEFCK